MTVLRLSSVLASLLLVGCDSLWDAANRPRLEADVRELFKTAGVVPRHLECRMVGSTRDAFCSFRMSPPESASVIHALGLELVQSSPGEASALARLAAHAGPNCAVSGAAPPATFGIEGRPGSLRLPGGSAFEYLLLTLDERTGQACVQVSYSFG